jgi:hypothetical protein
MNGERTVPEPELEVKGKRFGASGRSFLGLSTIAAVPGIVLLILTRGWPFALGLALIAVALVPAIVAVALLLISAVARWAARRRPFA